MGECSILITVILLALIFDYINGFHDASNAIATVVSTRALSLKAAVIMAAIFNFLGAVTGTAVAKTIAFGFADPAIITQYTVLATLIGACLWNLITWYYGLPSSSSHALIGGLIGAVVGSYGIHAFKWEALYQKVLIPLVLSPTLGFVFAAFLMLTLYWVLKSFKPRTVTSVSRKMQLISAASMAFSHGSADAQKSMGIITLAIVAAGSMAPHWMQSEKMGQVPFWVIVACSLMMALGTAAGGKKIIKTMGSKIIKITPLQGFVAETSGSLILMLAAKFGIPVSTTHCISACIMGSGSVKSVNAVKWGVAGNIVMAWVLTIPAAALISYLVVNVIKTLV